MPAARIVLVGGDRPVPVAAASAVRLADEGLRTLLVAADDPHRTLDLLLGVPLATEPQQLRPGLHALRLDPQEAFRDTAVRLLGRARTLFDLLGVEQLDRDELAALPGARHLALLDAVRTHGRGGGWDAVVLAGPQLPELLAALALPEQLRRYLDRLLPDQRQAARALRPMLAGLAGVPMPAEWLFEARTWASAELADVQGVLDAPTTTLRLAVDAPGGAQALAALRRARAGLALHERRVDAVVVTGVLPDGQDPFLAGLHGAQQEALAQLRSEWDAPVLAVPHPGREPEGLDQLPPLPELPPAAPLPERWVEDRLDIPPHVLVWHLPLPGAERGELDVVRRGDELVLGVGEYRRTLSLPSALRRCTVAGAALREGVLAVRFAPDVQLWPR